jgi:hypothetical protein
MTAYSPSRHIAAPRDLGRFRGKAEIDGQPSIAGRDAYDPSRHFAVPRNPGHYREYSGHWVAARAGPFSRE